jgi:hypothetical protein
MTKQPPKQKPFLTVDKTILCLFPSLDFNRVNVHANSKKKMNTMLKILDTVAKHGSITSYDLTQRTKKENDKVVFPRMGGDTADKALQELEELELLKSYETTSSRRTPKFPKVLTAKGVIACLSLPEFQKTKELEKILQRPTLKDSELVTLMRIYTDENPLVKAQFKDIVQKGQSLLVVLIKMLAERKINVELKTQEELLHDLKNVMDKIVNKKLEFSCFEHYMPIVAFFEGFTNRGEEMKKVTDEYIATRNAFVNNRKPPAELYEELCEKARLMSETIEMMMLNDKDFANRVNVATQSIEYTIKTCTDPLYITAPFFHLSDDAETKLSFKDPKRNAMSNFNAMRKSYLEQTRRRGFL